MFIFSLTINLIGFVTERIITYSIDYSKQLTANLSHLLIFKNNVFDGEGNLL